MMPVLSFEYDFFAYPSDYRNVKISSYIRIVVFFIIFSLHFFVFFFFFQAEDGIRDGTVTGVQTCALPISKCLRDHWDLHTQLARQRRLSHSPLAGRIPRLKAGSQSTVHCDAEMACRSEERRVGKECRSRWSSYD